MKKSTEGELYLHNTIIQSQSHSYNAETIVCGKVDDLETSLATNVQPIFCPLRATTATVE